MRAWPFLRACEMATIPTEPVAQVFAFNAVASAVLLPYSGLASVHGAQRRVLVLRGFEFASLAAVAVALLAVDGGVPWTPLALTLGPVLAAVAVRRSVLLPLARRTPVPAVREPVVA